MKTTIALVLALSCFACGSAEDGSTQTAKSALSTACPEDAGATCCTKKKPDPEAFGSAWMHFDEDCE
jgi:hypothetical protein